MRRGTALATLGCQVWLVLGCATTDGQNVTGATVSSTFTSDATTLGYTLDRPAGPGPFPIVVLVHGSGRTTRDEMLNLVPRFVGKGYAVFRYDKRGVGASGGTYEGVGVSNSPRVVAQLGRDARAALDAACALPGIDASSCGYFGASQAGWVLAEAMRAPTRAAWAVIFSGTTVSVGREIAYSNIAETGAGSLGEAYEALTHFVGNEGYDPSSAHASSTVPTLWLLGDVDHSTPARVTLRDVELLASRGVPFVARVYAGYDHALGPLVWPDVDVFLARFPARRR